MKGLILDVYKFYLFNYEDWLRLFEAEKEAALASLDDKQKESFNPYHFDYKQTKELFRIYEHLFITPDDVIWGAIGKKYFFIKSLEGIYKCALGYFNKDLSF